MQNDYHTYVQNYSCSREGDRGYLEIQTAYRVNVMRWEGLATMYINIAHEANELSSNVRCTLYPALHGRVTEASQVSKGDI